MPPGGAIIKPPGGPLEEHMAAGHSAALRARTALLNPLYRWRVSISTMESSAC